MIGVEWESDESCLDIDRIITYVIVLGWFKRQRTGKIRGRKRLTDFYFAGRRNGGVHYGRKMKSGLLKPLRGHDRKKERPFAFPCYVSLPTARNKLFIPRSCSASYVPKKFTASQIALKNPSTFFVVRASFSWYSLICEGFAFFFHGQLLFFRSLVFH